MRRSGRWASASGVVVAGLADRRTLVNLSAHCGRAALFGTHREARAVISWGAQREGVIMAVDGHVQNKDDKQDRVRIDTPGSLVAAVPALLGFVPTESIVCIALKDTRVAVSIRIDIEAVTDDPRSAGYLVTQFEAATDFDSLLLIAVAADVTRREKALRAVTVACMAAGHVVKDSIHVSAIEAGKRWRNLEGVSGALTDPASTQLAAVTAAMGRQMFGSRDALAALLMPTGRGLDVGSSPRRSEALGLVRAVREVVGRFAADQTLTDEDVCTVGRTVLDPLARDTLIALVGGDRAAVARDVFTEVARRCRGGARVEALAMVGAFAYVDRDGVLAGIAFEAAQADQPGHGLSALLDQALRSNITSADVADLLMQAANASAAQLGIEPIA